MAKQPRREGPADASTTIIAVELPWSTPIPLLPSPTDKGHLATSPFVAQPRAGALTSMRPSRRIRVTVEEILMPTDDDLLVLPHDEPVALRDFVECTYALYGWQGIRSVRTQLEMMLKLRERPDEVARESGEEYLHPPQRPGEPSGGTPGPTDISEVRRPPSTSAIIRQSEGLPGGVLLEQERPLPPGLTQKHLETRSHYDELRWRMGDATAADAHSWLQAFDSATTTLRQAVLSRMQSFEHQALDVTNELLRAGAQTVMEQVDRYFQWHRKRDIIAALDSLHGKEVDRRLADVTDLRTRLTKLRPVAEDSIAADERVERYKLDHLVVKREEELTSSEQTELANLRSTATAAKAAYGAAVAIEAADHPVLYRFDAPSLIKAVGADDKILGSLVFIRLKKTWDAQDVINGELRKHQVARELKTDEIKGDVTPEGLVGVNAKDSIWLYQRLLEKTLQRLPPEESAFMEIAIANTRAAFETKQADAAARAIVEGIGMLGLQIGLTVACPPAGFALDVAFSASDVFTSAKDYEKETAEALIDLDPRECLRQDEASAVPLILAVAGAALVAL